MNEEDVGAAVNEARKAIARSAKPYIDYSSFGELWIKGIQLDLSKTRTQEILGFFFTAMTAFPHCTPRTPAILLLLAFREVFEDWIEVELTNNMNSEEPKEMAISDGGHAFSPLMVMRGI